MTGSAVRIIRVFNLISYKIKEAKGTNPYLGEIMECFERKSSKLVNTILTRRKINLNIFS